MLTVYCYIQDVQFSVEVESTLLKLIETVCHEFPAMD